MRPELGRSSLSGMSTMHFCLQVNFRSSQDVGNKTNSQALSSLLHSLTKGGSQYLPLALDPLSMHLSLAAQTLSTTVVPLLVHICSPIFLLPPPSVCPSFNILLLCTSPTRAPHSPSPILALQSSRFHRSRLLTVLTAM